MSRFPLLNALALDAKRSLRKVQLGTHYFSAGITVQRTLDITTVFVTKDSAVKPNLLL